MKNKTFILIYLGTLGLMLYYAFTHPIINDGVYEYQNYLLNVKEGWKFRYSATNSCLISTWLPAMVQRVTNWDTLTLFKVTPPLFYALMPAFVYLIARRYLVMKYALMASLVIIFSSYISFFPDVGRVGVALGIMAGMVWALLEKKIGWSISFAILLVFAHYGTAIIAIGLVLAVFGFTLVFKRKFLPKYLVTLGVLVILTGVWHFGIAQYSGEAMYSTILQPQEAKEIMGEDWGNYNVTNIRDRDEVTQMAFGVGFLRESAPTKIEIVSNWLVVLFISLGMLIVWRNKKIDTQFKVMCFSLYGLILATIGFPPLSNYYGTQRVYFTACIVLAVCFPFGIRLISKYIHMKPMLVGSALLILYGVSASGLIYLPFGLTKTIPIIVRLNG